MFKKASDNVHYLDRAASHSTKGMPTGLVEQRRLDETDFYSDAANMERWSYLKALRAERKPYNIAYWGIIESIKTSDGEARRGFISSLKVIRRKLRALNMEIAELATVTRKPAGKVKPVFASNSERRTYYRGLKRRGRLTK
jgi:hypothetical protein